LGPIPNPQSPTPKNALKKHLKYLEIIFNY
jgi:hypothetical protein